MRSEAKRSYQNGFELTEQELRRIFDSACQQIARLGQGSPSTSFEVKFRNGVIAEPKSLDEILALENEGSGRIERLEIRLSVGEQMPSANIKLEFIDADSLSEPGYDSIRYAIVGNERDWVFITSSQLEERISRIKRFALNQLFQGKKRSIALLIAQMVVLIPLLIGMLFFTYSGQQKTIQEIEAIEASWKQGRTTDFVEIMLQLAKLQAGSQPSSITSDSMRFFLILLGTVIFVGALGLAWAYFFPVYNFVWGDYVSTYQRRKSIGRFLVVGVVLSIIISVIANYLSSALGVGR